MFKQDGAKEMRPIGETEFVQGIADQSASGEYGATRVAAGIVGYADLTLGGAVEPVLEAHIAASKNRFRGIRKPSLWDANSEIPYYNASPKGILLNSKFREGFACLRKYGLSYDSWLYFTQLTDLADLARAFPDTPIIVNHIGGIIGIGPYANRRQEVFQLWKAGIAELATCENVYIKVGGLGMPRCGFGWDQQSAPPSSSELAEKTAPYYLWCIEQLGVNRCMFESNFPNDKQSYSYTVVWNSFKRMTKGFSPEEKASLFHNTAVKVYRLAN
jgi:predicted TIM-barrel fold metal-dependent hydrolase